MLIEISVRRIKDAVTLLLLKKDHGFSNKYLFTSNLILNNCTCKLIYWLFYTSET